MKITSINNDKVKLWQKLKTKKYRDSEELFLVEDEHLINEALKYDLVKEIITLDESVKCDVTTYAVTNEIMKLLSDQVTSAKMIAVCKKIEEKDVLGNVLVLDNIQDPGNLGTMIRSAVAFNFDSIVLSNDSVDLYNPKVIRASEGMIFHINTKRCDIYEFLNSLDNSYLKVSTCVSTGKDIRSLKYNKIALVIGNEGNGVQKSINDICDEVVNIKMNKNTESLNAGVCASILMYEVNHE